MQDDLIHDLLLNEAELGALASSFYYTYLTLQIPAGFFVARFGPRKTMTIGLIGCAVSALGFGLTHQLATAEATRILMGMFAAPAVVSSLTIASRWFHPAKFALLAGLTEMLGAIGGAVGQDLLSLVVADWGWRGTMFACAATGGVFAALAWVTVRDIPPKHYPAETAGNRASAPKINLRRVLGRFQIWNIGIISGLIFSITTAFALLWCVPFLQTKYDFSLTHAAVASSMILWGNAAGLPAAGALSGKFRRRKPILFTGAAISLSLIGLVIYGPATPFPVIALALFACGLFSSVYVLAFEIAGEMGDERDRGAVMGMTNMLCMLVGGWLLQPLIGFLLRLARDTPGSRHAPIHAGAYESALTVLPAGIGLALLLLLFLPETSSRQTTHAIATDR